MACVLLLEMGKSESMRGLRIMEEAFKSQRWYSSLHLFNICLMGTYEMPALCQRLAIE